MGQRVTHILYKPLVPRDEGDVRRGSETIQQHGRRSKDARTTGVSYFYKAVTRAQGSLHHGRDLRYEMSCSFAAMVDTLNWVCCIRQTQSIALISAEQPLSLRNGLFHEEEAASAVGVNDHILLW